MAKRITKQEMNVKIVLITTDEDIIYPDGKVFQRRTRKIQYQSSDGTCLLFERPVATDSNDELLSRFVNSP